MTNVFGQTGKLRGASALTGWAKSVAAGFSRVDKLRGMDRAEFEQIARDLNLSPPELYGLLTGRRIAAEALDECLVAEFEASPQLAKRLRAIERKCRAAVRMSAPIAPCC
jgi:hypothetical protein